MIFMLPPNALGQFARMQSQSNDARKGGVFAFYLSAKKAFSPIHKNRTKLRCGLRAGSCIIISEIERGAHFSCLKLRMQKMIIRFRRRKMLSHNDNFRYEIGELVESANGSFPGVIEGRTHTNVRHRGKRGPDIYQVSLDGGECAGETRLMVEGALRLRSRIRLVASIRKAA
ncbi:hypothetical protein [Mesorhizobium sp. M1365]|uniref:hypothetical protein n=1 Tax=Mesorhizobium sp. M1365 TaxID=2957090 RepID=UPI003335CD2A